MKNFKKPIYVVLIAFLTIMISCSKSDDSGPVEGENPGFLGSYDITIDGQRYSGTVGDVNDEDGDTGFALATFQQESGKTMVGFALNNDDILVSCGFEYPNGQENNISLDEDGDSGISFMLNAIPNTGYSARSGTAKLNIREKINAPDGSGSIIAAKIEFQGTFVYYDANEVEKTAQVSGTLQNNLMGL